MGRACVDVAPKTHTHTDVPRRWMHRQWSGLSARERETICKDPTEAQMIRGRRGQSWEGGKKGRVWREGENSTHPVELGWPSTQTQALGWQTGLVTPPGRRWASQPVLASSGKG